MKNIMLLKPKFCCVNVFCFALFCRDMLSSIVHIVKECSDEVCILLEHFKKGLVTCEGIIFKIFFLNEYANCCKTYTIRYCFSSKRHILITVFSHTECHQTSVYTLQVAAFLLELEPLGKLVCFTTQKNII